MGGESGFGWELGREMRVSGRLEMCYDIMSIYALGSLGEYKTGNRSCVELLVFE